MKNWRSSVTFQQLLARRLYKRTICHLLLYSQGNEITAQKFCGLFWIPLNL